MTTGTTALGRRTWAGSLLLAAALVLATAVRADDTEVAAEGAQGEEQLFDGLIPGQALGPEALDDLFGRGVNDRGSVSFESTASESSSVLSEVVNSTTARTTQGQTASSGQGNSASGAARFSPGGTIGSRRLLPGSPGGTTWSRSCTRRHRPGC